MDFSREEYKIKYDELIEGRRSDRLERGELYTENHHIVPRSFFSSDIPDSIIDHEDNLVLLSGKEHYIAHYYLYHSLEEGCHEYHCAMGAMNIFNGALEGSEKDMGYTIEDLGDMYQQAKEDYREHLKANKIIQINQLCDFCDKHGRPPSKSKKYENEFNLATQLAHLRQNKKNNKHWYSEYDDVFISRNYPNLLDITEIKKVEQYSPDGKFIKEFSSCDEATKHLNNTINGIISCCSGHRQSYNGYLWKYKGSDKKIVPTEITEFNHKRPVNQYNLDCEFIAEYKNLNEATKHTGLINHNICNCCKGVTEFSGDFIWRFSDDIRELKPIKKPIVGVNILQYTASGEFVREYIDGKDVEKYNEGFNRKNIYRVCQGKNHSYKGFQWKYKGSTKEIIPLTKYVGKSRNDEPIIQLTMDGEFVKEYANGLEIKEENGYNRRTIYKVCRGEAKHSNGYQWKYKNDNKNTKAINQFYVKIVCKYSLDGNFLEKYESIAKASKENSLSLSSIVACAKHKAHTVGGYRWRYEGDVTGLDKPIKPPISSKKKSVKQFKMNGELVGEYKSISEASRQTNVNISSISRCCNGTQKETSGFMWEFSKEKGS